MATDPRRDFGAVTVTALGLTAALGFAAAAGIPLDGRHLVGGLVVLAGAFAWATR